MIRIYKGTSCFEFETERAGFFNTSAVYELIGMCKDWNWDRKERRLKLANQYYFYHQPTGKGVFPINLLDTFIQILDRNRIPHTTEILRPHEPDSFLNLTIKPAFEIRPEQADATNFLSDPKTNFKCLASQAGSGKTLMSITAAIRLNYPTICICSGLVEQWVDAWIRYTNIKPEEIFVIRGNATIIDLLQDESCLPKVIIASLETMRDFTQKKGVYERYPGSFMDLIERKNIGTKIMDEAHMAFHTQVKIDLVSNIKYNIYLSASYERNNKSSNRVFEKVFPPDIRFGENALFKYARVVTASYSLTMSPQAYTQAGSYSHFKYEKYILGRDPINKHFLSILKHYLHAEYMRYRQPGDKAIVFFALVKSIAQVVEYLRVNLDGVRVEAYTQEDPEEHLNADVIITTLKSAGTGKDIPGLITGVNTVSFASRPQCIQMLGRIRFIKDKPLTFVDLHNRSIKPHLKHLNDRLEIYQHRAKVVEATTY